jgi:amino acid adenylation domain-containing protein
MPHDDAGQTGRGCLYRLFHAAAARHPDRVAVIAPDGVRSYAELDADVMRLAGALNALGITPGHRLALLLERGADAVTALLASMRMGSAFVAMDPAFPPARLSAILADCRPTLVLYDEAHGQLLAGWNGPSCTVAEALASVAPPPPSFDAADDDAMYVIYTSGSTGQPKGIVQTFRTIRNLVRWENSKTGIQFAGRVLQNSSLAFDVSLQEILSTLTMGGSLVVSSDEEKLDPDLMISLLRRQRVNVVFFSVSTLTRLFATVDRLDELPDTLTDIVTAGEQLYVNEALRDYLRAHPQLRLHNHYGVSESHVVTAHVVSANDGEIPLKVPIGRPIAGAQVYLRSVDGHTMQPGETAEVVIAGECLALGYLNRPEEQAKRFVMIGGERHYLTGDLAFQNSSGELEFVGRSDHQLKIRGHLVEPGDVETALRLHPAVGDGVVDSVVTADGERQLVAWYTTTADCSKGELRTHLARLLPSFMLPSRLEWVATLPVGPTGKVDREALLARADLRLTPGAEVSTSTIAVAGPVSHRVLALLRRVLDQPDLAPTTAFFDAGATSLTLVRAAEVLSREIGTKIRTVDLFRFPSSAQLGAELDRRGARVAAVAGPVPPPAEFGFGEPLAVVGMAGRFPGARDIHALWALLAAGRHGLVTRPGEPVPSWWIPELPHADGPPPMVGLLEDACRFEPEFFGYSERAAEWLDPQHRLLLMCAYTALESAGHSPSRGGRVGVYAGSEFPSYIANVRPNVRSMDDYLQCLIGNDKDFLATRIAHKLNLTGPAVTVQTACSTSLVAVHLARQALLLGDCDLALAGGVSLQYPQEFGHHYQEGLIYSPDGMTRPFDEEAAGTNITGGVGLVVLKRLGDALDDGNAIFALVRGSAINNDGADKVGFTAPSVSGQAIVIRDALRAAGLSPNDIDFVEAHGTATPLGDAVEVAALHEVLGGVQGKEILLGSIKGNIGHANRAAGVAGLIKTILALHHGELPPTIGHHRPAAQLGLTDGPFRVPVDLSPLRTDGAPNRAGVSSFGFGGTNAHVVVEQWRRPAPASGTTLGPCLLTLTADRPEQLRTLATELADHLEAHPEITVADAAHSRDTRRDRRALVVPVVAQGREELVARLRDAAADFVPLQPTSADGVVMLLPGRAVVGNGARLYRRYTAFRDRADEVLQELEPRNTAILRDWLMEPARHGRAVAERSELLQPLIFLLSRATALLLMDWGVHPKTLIGSSLGEFTAAALAGALTTRDAAMLVEERGRLEDTLAPLGGMLSAEMTWESAAGFATDEFALAGHNSRGHVLFAGTVKALAQLEKQLAAVGVDYRRMSHRRPNHTALMGPAADGLRRAVRFVTWREPQIPIISCVDGQLASAEQLADPDHWVRHSCRPILFAEALDRAALTGEATVFLEVGPSAGLAVLAAFHFAEDERFSALSALPRTDADEESHLLERVGDLLRHGINVDLTSVHSEDQGRMVLLPPYPFRGKEYVLPPPEVGSPPSVLRRQPRIRWAYRMTWRKAPQFATAEVESDWLLVGAREADLSPLAARLAARAGGYTIMVSSADASDLARAASQWREGAHCQRLTVCYVDSESAAGARSVALTGPLLRVLLVYRELVRSFPVDRVDFVVATRGMYGSFDEAAAGPAALTTAMLVAAQEQPGLRTRHIDFADGVVDAELLLAEARSATTERLAVYDHGDRTVPRYEPTTVSRASGSEPAGRLGDTYLITGGLGAVGVEVCRYLGGHGARLLVIGRTDVTDTGTEGVAARRRLADLRAAGVEVCYERADVTSQEQLTSAIRAGEASLGPICGVVHAAADIGGDSFLGFLHDTAPETILAQAAVKVTGLELLDEVLRDRTLRFRLAFSSNSVVLGGLGYAAYAAANAAMGELVSQLDNWRIVDWDVWETDRAADAGIALGTGVTAQAMPLADALACLEDILAGPARRILVSTTDLGERIRLVEHLTGSESDPPETAIAETAGERPPATFREVARDAWRRALGISVDDRANFVSLGGDSLTAIKVVLEINRRLGCSLSAQDMLRAVDFADFVQRVEADLDAIRPDTEVNARRAESRADAKAWAATGRGNSSAAKSAVVATRTPETLLTATAQAEHSITSLLQERWFEMDSRGYGHIDLRVKIIGPLDSALAARALRLLCKRHAVLRSRYEPGERLLQHAAEGWTPALPTIDLRGAPDDAAGAALRDAEARALRRFDLTAEVPFDVELLQLAPQEHVLIGRMHHIAVDGWSFSLLLEDLERVYAELERGGDPRRLPELPQYAHFAAAQRAYVATGAIAEARTAWQRHFAGATGPTRLPSHSEASYPAEADPEAGRCVNSILDVETVSRLASAAQARRTTLFPLLVSAFAMMLRAVTGEEDLVFGTTAAGRHLPGTEDMIGVFVNPLPIRVDLAGVSGTGEMVDRVTDRLMEFHQYQNYLLADLVEHVEPFVGLDINETFHAYILFQNYPRPQSQGPRSYRVVETDDLGDKELAQLRRPHGKLMRDFELIVIERCDGRMSLNHWYRQGKFTHEQVQQWSGIFTATLQRLVSP